jgi:hypothetical protein
MSDSVIKTNFFSTVGTQKFVNETIFTKAITIQNKSFYSDGINIVNGNVHGRTAFSVSGYQTWGSSVMNPASHGNFAGAETTRFRAR